MKIPFTAEQFLEVFKRYNLAIWPLQIMFYLLAFTAIFFAIKKRSASNKIIAAILSFFWLWMGIAYHLAFFTTINKGAYLFAIMFISQGILFSLYGISKNKFIFQFQLNFAGITGAILIAFALIIYPILGYFFGHTFPYSPTFGLPCPTTIFTFGLLLWVTQKKSFTILFIPLLWSFIGYFAAYSLKIYEDVGLVSGLVVIVITSIGEKENQKQTKASWPC